MFLEVEDLLSKQTDEPRGEDDDQVFIQMMGHFLSTLTAWGPTRSLREKIQFHTFTEERRKKKTGSINARDHAMLLDAEKSLERRLHQTSSGYLQLPSPSSEPHTEPDAPSTTAPPLDDTMDSLFSVDVILSKVSASVPLLADSAMSVESEIANNHAALEALAELYMMKGRHKMALRCFLAIGCLHISPDVQSVEDSAIDSVNGKEIRGKGPGNSQYGFVLSMIEFHHLHQCLLDDTFLASSVSDERKKLPTPLVALMQLVGLEDAGDFLVEHCVPPFISRPSLPLSPQSSSGTETDERQNGNETLPINLVADQLRPHPKLLHWYLHQIFTNKPEIYVKFPRTAVPPRLVTELHRSHLELYIEYTDKRDSAKALAGTETYNLERMTTPLLSFLKVSYPSDKVLLSVSILPRSLSFIHQAALPLGGIRSDEARRLLEVERTGNKQGLQSDVVQYPHHFALELAYIIERFGKGTEEDAKQILDLYLNGSKSLMLAVSYAQRNTEYSSQLWSILIDHCLHNAQDDDGATKDGSLFGSLLECAALSGADLAHLVTQIPQGMNVEGLRPRLVAAVADYRWKLKMHEAASTIGTNERIVLLRELAHRSRRGTRFSQAQLNAERESLALPPSSPDTEAKKVDEQGINMCNRPIERPNRYRQSFVVPIR